jgi:hypothetical protein
MHSVNNNVKYESLNGCYNHCEIGEKILNMV